MRAAVYKGASVVEVESVPTPEIGPGELLIRVEACGICHTDLKKIEYNLLAPPRIYGHETAGVVARVGAASRNFEPGDRVIVFHHIPCGKCFYCRRKLYAQCPVYKKVGVTAGFEPAGGGFSQYRARDGLDRRARRREDSRRRFLRAGVVCGAGEHLPESRGAVRSAAGRCGADSGTGADRADFHHAGGAHGAHDRGHRHHASRRGIVAALRRGAVARSAERGCRRRYVGSLTEGRGADLVIVAASAPGIVEQAVRCSRPGAQILLFAQTSDKERIEVSGAGICVGERMFFGSYSASVDLQKESATLVFSGELPVDLLISHRLPLVRYAFRHRTRVASGR